jgi:hypothetical protein
MKLFVGGISAGLDEIDLKEMFELYGEVSFAQIIKDRATGKTRGLVLEAMDLLDGVGLFGKKISVKEAGEPPKTNSDSRWNSRDSTPRKRY